MSPTKVCAKENRQSNECGKKGSNYPATCCSGLVCNTNFKCVKEENYGCAGKTQDAKNVARNGKEPHLYAALVLYVTLVNRLVFYHDFNVLFV